MKYALAAFLALGVAPTHAALVSFDAPGGGDKGGQGTFVNSINLEGNVTGNVIDENGVSTGFERMPDGTITLFSAEANADTHSIAISPVNAEAGYYLGDDGHNHGFIRVGTGVITSFDPKNSTGTQTISINRHGNSAGQYSDSKAGGLQRGFLRRASGRFQTFDGNTGVQTFGTFVTGINNARDISGFWFDGSSAMHGFLRARNGVSVQINIDGAGTGALQGTQVEAVNEKGDCAGFYTDEQGHRHGFVRTHLGAIETFDAPGAGFNTVVASINDGGQVAGYYTDMFNIAHGFVRNRGGNFKVFDAPGAALESGKGTFVSGINQFGAVSGDSYDHKFRLHGFAGKP